MNHEQRVADVERIMADLASTVRVLGDQQRLLGSTLNQTGRERRQNHEIRISSSTTTKN